MTNGLQVSITDHCLLFSYMFVSDSNLCLHSDVMLCLYQVTEYIRFSVGDAADSHWTSTTIPTALSKAFVNIASHVQQAPASCHKVTHMYNRHQTVVIR